MFECGVTGRTSRNCMSARKVAGWEHKFIKDLIYLIQPKAAGPGTASQFPTACVVGCSLIRRMELRALVQDHRRGSQLLAPVPAPAGMPLP